MNDFGHLHPRHLCNRCMRHLDEHGCHDNPHRPHACPGEGDFPIWRETGNEEADGQDFDRRVRDYWNEKTSTFRPIS